MNRRIATLAAAATLAAGIAIAPSASAGGNVAVSVGLPGLSVGYSSNGYGFVAATPAPYYPAPYFAPPVVTYAPVPVYAPFRPYAYRHWYRAPVRVGYYGHVHHW